MEVFIAMGGQYKENFPTRVALLDKAVRLAATASESVNPVREAVAATKERLLKRGFSAARADQFGLQGKFIAGDAPFGDFYVSPEVPLAQRDAVIAAAQARLLALPQVAAVLTRAEIEAAPKPDLPPEAWTLAQRAAANYVRARSGDLYVVLKPRITPIPDGSGGFVATHGSAWDYDRRVPMLFWWPKITPFEQPNSVETVDILPTLASLIGLAIPAGEIDGRCLDLDASAATSCH